MSEFSASTPQPMRPKYRVPLGMPVRDDNRREGALISLLVHLVITALIIAPIVWSRTVLQRIEQGAGGPGPAGGGGGGHLSSDRGGYKESLRYVRVAPEPVPQQPKPTPIPKPTPTPPPVVPQVTPPKPTPPVQQAQEVHEIPAPMQTVASTPGTGAGTGSDGTNGNGPGSGGGVGAGVGTGRGSGVGPGTGGGNQTN